MVQRRQGTAQNRDATHSSAHVQAGMTFKGRGRGAGGGGRRARGGGAVVVAGGVVEGNWQGLKYLHITKRWTSKVMFCMQHSQMSLN